MLSNLVIPFVCANVLGMGIGIGGMLNPIAAQRMFSAPYKIIKGETTFSDTDFTLMIVFMSALIANLILYHSKLTFFKKPLFGHKVKEESN